MEKTYEIYGEDTAKAVAAHLLEIQAIKLSPNQAFTWASGWKSPIYCDNRLALSYPKVRKYVRNAMANLIKKEYPQTEVIAGVATGAIAIGILVAEALELPFIYVRPEAKSHGRQNQIEGQVDEGKKVLVIEDLISTGKSSLLAVDALRNAKVDVLGMVGIFSYGFAVAEENMQKANCDLHVLSNYTYLINEAEKRGYVSSEDLETLSNWRIQPDTWGR
jgi:orotate phosphoribosyltransferase